MAYIVTFCLGVAAGAVLYYIVDTLGECITRPDQSEHIDRWA
jgi:hypothetical protein